MTFCTACGSGESIAREKKKKKGGGEGGPGTVIFLRVLRHGQARDHDPGSGLCPWPRATRRGEEGKEEEGKSQGRVTIARISVTEWYDWHLATSVTPQVAERRERTPEGGGRGGKGERGEHQIPSHPLLQDSRGCGLLPPFRERRACGGKEGKRKGEKRRRGHAAGVHLDARGRRPAGRDDDPCPSSFYPRGREKKRMMSIAGHERKSLSSCRSWVLVSSTRREEKRFPGVRYLVPVAASCSGRSRRMA